ncbi:TrmH family RNA methyltransferase [Jeotgalibacillus aurantiacus]|uniref:TrmH family RNA methyltransferase n=1 Tax=Jeotgalibacillus aurantiacus TaxID=2763266 RepID=UPI001D0A2665|nr:RNA methyltransferase [Jeotgalibacillus aurantiacus]
MSVIQSMQNGKVKEWKKLLTKKGRDKSGLFLVEGYHLIEEAILADAVIEVIVREGVEIPGKAEELPVSIVTEEISAALAETEHSQGVFAICRQPDLNVATLTGKQLLILDSVQDPGNIGTMIRTADAAGIDAVILGKGTADPYNAKILRAAQGSHFHLPIVKEDIQSVLAYCKNNGISVFGTSLQEALPYREVDSKKEFALIMGNEGAGMKQELLEQTDQNLYIPIYGKSESLNVAIAAGILLYHLKG